jgi:hypothetical protein
MTGSNTLGSHFRVGGGALQSRARRVWRCDICGTIAWTKSPCAACKNSTVQHFDSSGEAQRYAELVLLEKAGEIFNLQRQVRCDLHVRSAEGKRYVVGTIVIDYRYLDHTGRMVYEDYKGRRNKRPVFTDLAAWKFKHFEIEYGEKIYVTGT